MLAGALACTLLLVRDIDRHFPVDLDQPPGMVTHLRLKAWAGNPAPCLEALTRAGVVWTRAPDRDTGTGCGFNDAVTRRTGPIDYGGTVLLTCPAMAALVLWERHSVLPASEAILGSPVRSIAQAGTYACRNVNHRAEGRRSQHAGANAIDISAFRLADGRRITLSGHWRDEGAAGDFLRAVRDGACRPFAAVLSPDYNAAHADHFHLDMGRWQVCR